MIFEADSQLSSLLVSVASGFLSGAATGFFDLSAHIKKAYITYPIAVLRALICAVLYLTVRFIYEFPDLKWYMTAGFFIGFALYIKTFAKIIAKGGEKLYNTVIKSLKKRRARYNVAREKKKNSRRRNRVDGAAFVHSYRGNDLSDGHSERKKDKAGRIKSANKTA